MWRAQPGALMLLGRGAGPVPKAGSARIATLPGVSGVFRAEFWQLQGEPDHAFLAAIRLPQTADRTDTADLVLRGARGADRDLRLALVGASDAAAFGIQVAAIAGAHACRLTRFMLDVLEADDGSDTRQPSAVLESFLTHAARADGCVELIMHVPHRGVLLQGWGTRPAEPVELLLPGTSLVRRPAQSGDFPRSDIAAPATGNVLVVPPELAGAMTSLERIFLLTGDDLLCRHVIEPRVLDVDASIGQIRHLLPRLTCPAPMHALLRATLQPRYEGRDTLNGSGRPVRAALDMAVAATGAGAYLSGWLFDPTCHTAELHLCADGCATRLDETWVRVAREDVSVAFRADPAFPPPLTHEAGFAVAVPMPVAPSPGQAAYLRFTFTDGDLAFIPIRFADCRAPTILTALLASVDLHKQSGIAIVERHLAPFIAKLPPRHDESRRIVLRGPLDRPRAIVVPLATATLPRSFISSFLRDPATADEAIIFVCGPEWNHAQHEILIDLIGFYALPATIVAVSHTLRSVDAIREATSVSRAEHFLLTSPRVVGSTPGWRKSLHRAASPGQVACPTVLFEDRSIRFAGPKIVNFLDRQPFVSVQTPLAGAWADLASTADATRAEGITFTCCLIPRAAIPALERAMQFMTEPGQETAFFLSLREAGMTGIWVPTIQVSAPEDDAALTLPVLSMPVVSLIDGWTLRHIWGGPAQCVS